MGKMYEEMKKLLLLYLLTFLAACTNKDDWKLIHEDELIDANVFDPNKPKKLIPATVHYEDTYYSDDFKPLETITPVENIYHLTIIG